MIGLFLGGNVRVDFQHKSKKLELFQKVALFCLSLANFSSKSIGMSIKAK